jgi:tight adherence protein B
MVSPNMVEMKNIVILLLGSVFIFTILFGAIFSVLTRRKRKILARVESYLTNDRPEEEKTSTPTKKSILLRLVSTIGKKLEKSTLVMKWEKKVAEAGLTLKPGEFYFLKICITLLSAWMIYIFVHPILALVVSFIVWFWLPGYYLKKKKSARLNRCVIQLSSALGTMANAMRAGFSFMQAMQMVAKEMPDPLGPEFDYTLREINLGVPLEQAFQGLVNRLPDKDLEMVISALLIQRSTGGNLAELLETMQETVRGRIRIKEELKTLTAQGRISAWIISLLPIFIGVVVNFINPEYFGPMLTHPLGWGMLGLGSISGMLGWIMIQKIVRIEV